MSQPLPFLIPQPKRIKLDPKGRELLLLDTDVDPGSAASKAMSFKGDPRLGKEAYRIKITQREIILSASSYLGDIHAQRTLFQICVHYGYVIPCMEINDAPDFPHRGFMLDVSRGRVPKLETLYELVDWLDILKYNQLQLYVEHTYAFKKHPLIGKGHSPLSASELRKLDAYCKSRGIELVPNLQSFGHAAHILKHKRYHQLAESEFRGGWTLSPVEPSTYKLLKELYSEFLPNFSHRPYFNVGCDETWDLGKGKSAKLAKKIGLGRVYLGHLLKVHKLARQHKRRMMFWGDIIEKYPELMPEIPKDVVVLNWEYETEGREKLYRKRLEPSRRSGLEHWVCPGTSAWNSFFFRKTNARINMREFAKAGVAAGAKGYLLTTWGDNGHYNFLSASLWAIAYGADCAWRANPDPAAEKKFDERFASFMLCDDEGEFIEPLRLLGDLYRAFGVTIRNTSPERMFFTGKPQPSPLRLGVVREIGEYNRITKKNLEKALAIAEKAIRLLGRIETDRSWIERVRQEWLMGGRLAAHACKRALWHNHRKGDPKKLRKEIEELARLFEKLWLGSDRESDLEMIRREFKQILREYTGKASQPIIF